MLRAGDELGHTQHGNNNAYCQDNDLSWLQWDQADTELTDFCARLIALRAAHPVFRRRRFFEGRALRGTEISDIAWLRPDGAEMSDEDWNVGFARSLAVFLNGHALPDPDPFGQQIHDDTFLILLNASHGTVTFNTPPATWATGWSTVVDTAGAAEPVDRNVDADTTVDVAGFSLQLLRADVREVER